MANSQNPIAFSISASFSEDEIRQKWDELFYALERGQKENMILKVPAFDTGMQGVPRGDFRLARL